MEKLKNKNAFSLVELVVVISILAILSVISFVSYTSYILDARNSARKSDMSNLKMALKNHKLKNGNYPIPGAFFDITNSGTIIKQGFLNNDVATQEIIQKPTDPLLKTKYYTYSITNNKLFFQIAMSIEKSEEEEEDEDSDMIAYVDGDYQQVAEFVPTIVFATSGTGTIESLSGSFIVNNGTLNLPYDETGNVTKTATNLSQIIGENGVIISKYFGYYTCQEIYENGNSMGSGSYKILKNDGSLISSGCLMN